MILTILTLLGIYAIGWAAAFITPYRKYRKLYDDFYGEPKKTTVLTSSLRHDTRTIVITMRELGMEGFDRVIVRTPGWDEAEVAIPRPGHDKRR